MINGAWGILPMFNEPRDDWGDKSGDVNAGLESQLLNNEYEMSLDGVERILNAKGKYAMALGPVRCANLSVGE